MEVTLTRTFHFEAAHHLPRVPEGHKCRRLHGHSFEVDVEVTGPVGSDTGWFVDYASIKAAWRPLDDQLDHRYLNEIEGLENPTSERLALWIWERLVPNLPGLSCVKVRETCTSQATYRGR